MIYIVRRQAPNRRHNNDVTQNNRARVGIGVDRLVIPDSHKSPMQKKDIKVKAKRSQIAQVGGALEQIPTHIADTRKHSLGGRAWSTVI